MTRPLHIFVVLWVSVSGLTTARADRFTVSNQPLQITNTGFILAPSSLSHPNEFGRVIDNGEVKYLSNILLSRGEPISGRGQDGIFRKIRLNPETGELQNADGTELNHPETIADFKDYFIALNMTQNSSIQKFMTKYFSGVQEVPNSSNSPQSPTDDSNHAGGNSQSSNQPHPETDSSSAKRNTESNEPLPSETNAPSQNTKEQTSNESGQKTPALDTNKFNKRFQLSTISTEAANRPFINGKKTVEASECGASLVSRLKTEEKDKDNQPLCKVAFFTAGHCIPTQSEISISGNPSEVALDSFKLKTPSGVNIEGRAEKVEVVLSKNFNGRRRFVRNANRQIVIADITSVKDDYAMLFFKVACSAVKENEVTPFSSSPLRVGDPLSAITQDNQESLMSIQGRDRNDSGKISSGLQRPGSVRPGDSGGPVFNRFGQLVGAISHVTFNQGADISTANGMTFEADGIRWAQALIKERHGSPVSNRQNIASGPAGQKQLNPELDTASATPPQQKRDRTSEVQAPQFKEIAARTQDLKNVMEQAQRAGYKNIIIRYGNDTSCGNCRELRGQLQAQFAQEKGVLVIKVEDSTPIAGQGIPQSELRSLDETGQWKRIGKFRIGSGAAADHFKEQISNLSRERISENNNTNPDPQNPAESQITESSIPGFDQLKIHTDGSGASKSLLGKNTEGNFVPVFIDRQTGRPVTRDKKPLNLSQESLEQINRYYEQNANKLRPQERNIATHFMSFYSSQFSKPTNPNPNSAQEGNSGSSNSGSTVPPRITDTASDPSTQDQIAKANKTIRDYENLHYFGIRSETGRMEDLGQRERFPADTFRDVPQGGNGKLILAYFGPRNASLENQVKNNPLVEVRQYAFGSPEHRHASLFGTQALGIDGLGRKVTRYTQSPEQALQSLMKEELPKLQQYLEAKKVLTASSTNPSTQSSQNPSKDQTPSQRPPIRQPSQSSQVGPKTQSPDLKQIHSLLQGKCINCHRNNGFDPSFTTAQGLAEHLKSAPDSVINKMANFAKLTPEEKTQLESFRNSHSGDHGASKTESREGRADRSREIKPREIASEANSPVNACYMSEQDRTARLRALPNFNTEGSPIAQLVDSNISKKRVVFYDSRTVPRAWQRGNLNGEPTLGSPVSRVNADMINQTGYHSDAGTEFPWNKPAGTDISSGVATEKFFIPGTSGRLAQLVTRTKASDPRYFGSSENVNGPNLGWNFENGATFGEVLKVKNPETQEQIPFEIRIRRKNEQGVWQMDVLRPFSDNSELTAALKKLCEGNSQSIPGCSKVKENWAQIEKPQLQTFVPQNFINNRTLDMRVDPLKLSSTAGQALQKSTTLQVLPDLPPDVVTALLKTTPFKSVFGKPWNGGKNGSGEGWAPTARGFNIVPQNYFGGMIPTTQQSCMKCHDSAGRHADNFDPDISVAASGGIRSAPNDAPRARTWYDFVPGNDGILSWHPFSPQAVKAGTRYGTGSPATPVSFIECMKRSGLLK